MVLLVRPRRQDQNPQRAPQNARPHQICALPNRCLQHPCRLVVKNRERKRERFLTDGEFRHLGRVLDEAETSKGSRCTRWRPAIRLLLLAGCRKGKILNLK